MGPSNLKQHEIVGLAYQFLGASCIGIGIYYAAWAATRSIYLRTPSLLQGWEFLLFPLLFGTGAVLWSLGGVELKEAEPGYGLKKR